MSGLRVGYWLVCAFGMAFLAYFTLVRRSDDGVPPWVWLVGPPLVVLLIGYDVWYRRTKSTRTD